MTGSTAKVITLNYNPATRSYSPPAKTNERHAPVEAPNSPEAERAVLGSCLINADTFIVISVFLKTEHFFHLRHGYIWRAMERLNERREPIDNLTVTKELEAVGYLEQVGGAAYISQLVADTPTFLHAEIYGRIVERAATRRSLMIASDEIKALALDESLDIESIGVAAENKLLSVTQRALKESDITIAEAVDHAADIVEQRISSEDTGFLPTGFQEFDEKMSGLEKGKFHVLAANTGMGQTLLMLQMALQMARLGLRVYFLSNEYKTEGMTFRMLAMESGVNSLDIRKGVFKDGAHKRFIEACSRVSKLPIVMDYIYPLTPPELRAKATRVSREQGIDVLMIDGIYKMRSPESGYDYNRVLELGHISEQLINLAVEFNVPLLTSHQVSDLSDRRDKRPTVNDLAWSKKIGQDADVLMFLYREGYWDTAAEFPNQTEWIIPKGRDNWTGTIPLYFDDSIPKFTSVTKRSINLGDM